MTLAAPARNADLPHIDFFVHCSLLKSLRAGELEGCAPIRALQRSQGNLSQYLFQAQPEVDAAASRRVASLCQWLSSSCAALRDSVAN